MNDIAFYRTVGGQNSAGLAERLSKEQYARGINIAIDGELPGTRIRARVVPMSGEAAEIFATLNFQGGIRYNPAEGQGAISVGRDESSFLFAVGGLRLQVNLTGRGVDTAAVASDVSDGLFGDARLHLVYWSQWENYALAGDGNGNTWIWSGSGPAFNSTGYNNTDKEASRVPNGATAMAPIHGRGVVVVNSKSVLVGNLLNSLSQKTAEDMLRFTEQVYFATGTYFAPPTRIGSINAIAALPVMDTAHGQGDLLVHCQRGIFSINLNIYPRTLWSSAPMVKLTHMGSGATGPYAVCAYQGDQLFRSRVGVQTIRSARASSGRAGSPQKSIARVVGDFMKADAKEYLRFCSVEAWEEESRGFVTCSPIVQGRFRWHRGFIVANFDPVVVQESPAAWEGLWTLPPGMGGVVQFISGEFDGEDRLFAVCHDADGRNRLVEFRRELRDDILEDGTRSRVRCQMVTRRDDQTDVMINKTWEGAALNVRGVRGRVDWGVWVRSLGSRKWTFWRGGYVEACSDCGDELAEPDPWEGEIQLGSMKELAEKCFKRSARNIQFLIRWAGEMQIDSLSFTVDPKDPDDGKIPENNFQIVAKDCVRDGAEYSDYEYLELSEAQSWLRETQPSK